MTEQEARAIFLLAGFEVKNLYQIGNQYWPEAYVEERKRDPWWLVQTPAGLVKIGWRKRVISIDWEDTPVRVEVTTDQVTKDKTMVHAYSFGKAVDYVTQLRREYVTHMANLVTSADILPINNSKGE
jgi:hypothetical protein